MQNKRIRSLVIACVTWGLMLGCKHTPGDPLVHGWEEIDAPIENAPILQEARGSPCVWLTTSDAGSVRITDLQRRKPTIQEVRLQTRAGVLVGTNKGTNGGSLSLVRRNGLLIRSLIDENVLQLVPVKSGVLVFTGPGQPGVRKGAVWLFFADIDGGTTIRRLVDLDGTPRAVYESNGDTLVVTGHGVVRIDPSLGVDQIAALPLANTLPNSVARDVEGRIYIGMNAFVARLVPAGPVYDVEWFTRPGCLR